MSDALKRAKAKYYQKIKDDPNYKEKMANNSKTSSLTAGVAPGIVRVIDHLPRCCDESVREGQQHAP